MKILEMRNLVWRLVEAKIPDVAVLEYLLTNPPLGSGNWEHRLLGLVKRDLSIEGYPVIAVTSAHYGRIQGHWIFVASLQQRVPEWGMACVEIYINETRNPEISKLAAKNLRKLLRINRPDGMTIYQPTSEGVVTPWPLQHIWDFLNRDFPGIV